MKVNKTLKYILITFLVEILAGVILSSIFYYDKDDKHILVLGFVATIFAALGLSVINLIYFLPRKYSKVKFTLPGIISMIFIFILFGESKSDFLIFSIFGYINLIMGIIWTIKAVK